jgi:hypothetical protein
MKYMMFVTTDPETAADETGEGTLDIETWVNTYDAAGKRVLGERLRPVEDSTTVRRRGGKVMVTDGPFAESREWIVGFDILDCRDLDEAIEIAALHPNAASGRLELRPFWPFEDEAG